MKSLARAALMLAFSSAMPAYAAPVLVEFTAEISSMTDMTVQSHWIPLQSSNALGYDISVGETVKLYFSYDTETVLPIIDSPYYPTEHFSYGNFQQSVKFANGTSALSYSNRNWVHTYEYSDSLLIQTGGLFAGNSSSFSYRFEWESPYAPVNQALPGADQWSSVKGLFGLVLPSAGWITVGGEITSVQVVSSVPEPSTYLMLGAGLGLIALSRRKRRTETESSSA
ncbi:PEP-CTERM sorting domain-containing protein [Pseudoduganella plicata]|uniref:PEP-CTERM sorting domain-containing protein n=1 Tax=Pseudoduganella plicata TaxID=321984 RepID=A0A4P7BDH5_9BURK|nr:PEP-CTERM sorting domain-containing protein [Pseudoduganella plicata]QBQ36203.1 PEP-CTERM sorting domain-containing protein [Pseudoduganella plicata]GGY77219.1 hypothetical protein GCM10007388_07480 [Pseudoduganella plicata]